nr:putative toxin-antitoxin system toxin component, PIN family [uncultured Emticicia sp.]
MRVVIDTNILVASLSSNSKNYWIIEALLDKKIELCLTNDILLEYEEVLKIKYSALVADAFLASLKDLSNVYEIQVYFQWSIIQTDSDDNKFVDCAIAGNVDFLISNDKHFSILKTIDFPKLNLLRLEEFEEFYKNNL